MTKKKSTAAKAHAKALPVAAPPPSAFAGTQLSLFQAFLCNTDEERDQLSNTIDPSIPHRASPGPAPYAARPGSAPGRRRAGVPNGGPSRARSRPEAWHRR